MRKVTYDFSKVTDAQAAAVAGVLAEAAKHQYSVSRVYGAYNAVMGTNDEPQSCPSCLRTRVKELQDWKRAYDARTTEGAGKAAKAADTGKAATQTGPAAQYTDANAEGYVAPGDGVTRLNQADGLPFDFTPGDDLTAPHKGTVKYADGSTVKPGKYTTEDGSALGVQPGGKATITAPAEDLT